MKIIIFGCQKIAVDCIEFLSNKNNVEIPLVISYDLPLDITYGYKSVANKCHDLNLACKKPRAINQKLVDQIIEINPEFIFSIYYRKIFPISLLKNSKNTPVNIHPSLLPDYRGPVPTAWTIRNGEKETGVTIHLMDEKIDTGDILVQESTKILEDETGFQLYERCMDLGTNLFKKNFDKIINKSITPKKQVGIGSYYGKLKGKHKIDWQNTVESINNMIRVHAAPFNPAETILYNHYFFINKATKINNPKYVVSCADGFLKLKDFDIHPPLTEIEKSVYLKVGNKFS